jgi:alanine dehydrogenase
VREDGALGLGVNTAMGQVVNAAVAEALGRQSADLESVLAGS